MIPDRDLVALHLKGSPFQPEAISRERGEKWLAETAAGQSGKWELLAVASCRCCGEPAWSNLRCTKHQDRNPCVVEGCKRTRKANGHLSDHWFICGEHWKAYVPPGSPERRVINRFFRLAKKLGYARNDRWPEPLETRYWRFWVALVARVARRSGEGYLDQKEIERMFGWADEG
jgi:hypothetical protein